MITNPFHTWRPGRLVAAAAGLVLVLTVPVLALTVSVGDVVPDFEALDQDNATFRLSDEAGKVVLLHFCSLWCQPCRASAEAEAALAAAVDAEIGAANWELVDALIEDNFGQPSGEAHADLWRSAFGTPARTLHAGGDTLSELWELVRTVLELQAIPTYLVVAPDGTISYIQEGFDGNNQPLIDAVVAAWYAHQTPETELADLIGELTAEGGVGQAIAAKLNAAYGLMTDDDPANDHAVVNVLRAVLRQVDAQAGKQLTQDRADYVTGIVVQLVEALEAS